MAPIRTSSSTTGAGGRASDRSAEGTSPTAFSGAATRPSRCHPFDGALKPNQMLETAPRRPRSSTRPRISRPTARRSTSPTARRFCGSTQRRTAEVRRFDRADHRAVLPAGWRPRRRARRARGAACSRRHRPVSHERRFRIRRSTRSTRCRRDLRGTLVATDGSTHRAPSAMGARPDGARPHRPGAVARHRQRQRAHHRCGACITRSASAPRAMRCSSAKAGDIALSPSPPDGGRRTVLDNLPVYPSRLSPASSRRLLADGVRRAHPARRVRAARKCLPASHDERDRPGVLDRAKAAIRPVVPGADAGRAHQDHGRRQAMGAAAVLWPRHPAETTAARRFPRCTAGSTASTMAWWPPSRWTARCIASPRDRAACLRVPLTMIEQGLRA